MSEATRTLAANIREDVRELVGRGYLGGRYASVIMSPKEWDVVIAVLDTDPAIPSSETDTEWLDISTAPKDGSWLLLFWPAMGGDPDVGLPHSPTIAVGKWCRPEKGLLQHWAINGRWTPGEAPTHWRPLPSPPNAEHGEAS